MFTGIVEIIGTVTELQPLDSSASGGGGTSLTISGASDILKDARLGDSICVNGACLTVTELPSSDSFKVGIAPETLRRTNLGDLQAHSRVNLEPALSASARLGGHMLQGHVDTIATVATRAADGNAVTLRLAPREKGVLRYVVEKGFVALDGASLTVTAVDDAQGWFEVMLIAYTQERIVTANKKEGEGVNIEVDQVGKYVEKSVAGYFAGQGAATGDVAVLEKMVQAAVDKRLGKA